VCRYFEALTYHSTAAATVHIDWCGDSSSACGRAVACLVLSPGLGKLVIWLADPPALDAGVMRAIAAALPRAAPRQALRL